MLPQIPQIIPFPFAQSGQKNNIATDPAGGSDPAASWSGGFPPITMIPREAGGKPPYGQDFNGLFFALSQHLFFLQSGGVYPWFDALDYPVGAHVLGSDGQEYAALQPSGPDISGVGAQDPITAAAYWQLVPDAAALASKADINLSNLTATGLAAMAHAAMPSAQTISYSLGQTSDTNLGAAPADGWLMFQGGLSGVGGVGIYTEPHRIRAVANGYSSATQFSIVLPVSKGDEMHVTYSTRPADPVITFFYANGGI